MFRTRASTLDELIARVQDNLGISISKKTIQNDIQSIKKEAIALGGELKCTDGRYLYQPKNLNLYEVKASPDSLIKMRQAASILRQIPGLDLYDDLKDILEKLEMRSEEDPDEGLTYIQFDTRPQYSGSKYLSELVESILGKTVISFEYKPFHANNPTEVILHPYLLKEYNNRWFLFGLQEITRLEGGYKVFSYALDRIQGKIKPKAGIEYYYHFKFDPDSYHKSIIGVTLHEDASIEEVKLKFSDSRAPYIETNPLHHSQLLLKGEKSTFSYKLIPNKELESLILSFGPDVVVLGPESLKKRISLLTIEASKGYL